MEPELPEYDRWNSLRMILHPSDESKITSCLLNLDAPVGNETNISIDVEYINKKTFFIA